MEMQRRIRAAPASGARLGKGALSSRFPPNFPSWVFNIFQNFLLESIIITGSNG
jgi:hypothetical protein